MEKYLIILLILGLMFFVQTNTTSSENFEGTSSANIVDDWQAINALAQISADLMVNGGLKVPGKLDITGNLSATGTLAITGVATVGSLISTGAATVDSLTSNGAANVGSLTSTGAANINTLTATGAANVGSLKIGDATLTWDSGQKCLVSNNIIKTPTTAPAGTLSITGEATVGSLKSAGTVTGETSYFGTGKSKVQIGQGYMVDGACVYASANDLLIGSSTNKIIAKGDINVEGAIKSKASVWNTSSDGMCRTHYSNNLQSYYASGNGEHRFRTGATSGKGGQDGPTILGDAGMILDGSANLTIAGNLTANNLLRYEEKGIKYIESSYTTKFVVPNKMAMYTVYASRSNGSATPAWVSATLHVYPGSYTVQGGAYGYISNNNYRFTNYYTFWNTGPQPNVVLGTITGCFTIAPYQCLAGINTFGPSNVLCLYQVDANWANGYDFIIQQIC